MPVHHHESLSRRTGVVDDRSETRDARSPESGSISRRGFIAGATAAAAVAGGAIALDRLVITPQNSSKPSAPLSAANASLVMCTLYGGNDGLNTLVPYQDSRYQSGRGTLTLAGNEVIPLDAELALNGNLAGFKKLWDNGQLAVIRGVGYPNPVFSHFRGMDIVQSAVPESDVSTGWLGRWMDATGSDPLRAVSVGGLVPLMFLGERSQAAAVPTSPMVLPGASIMQSSFSAMSSVTTTEAPVPANIAQSAADMLRVQHAASRALVNLPAADSKVPTGSPGGPGGSALAGAKVDPSQDGNLAGQLDVVSRLIAGDIGTKVYGVSMNSYDTHSDQKGTHQRLLAELDQAVGSWVARMSADPRGQDAVMVIYSEFGRRMQANASGGTDHGAASVAFVVGAKVKGGYYGDQPSLAKLDDGNLVFTTDFRSIYATVLAHVLGEDPKVALGKNFPTLGFI